ncbi:MAG TPA: DNA/RNA non-specific endonuclease [Pyrinomonadaceae bacterium]|jgi:endonuclease G
MKNVNRVCSAAIRRASLLPDGTFKPRKVDLAPNVARDVNPGDMARRAGFLTRGGAQATRVEFERLLGTNDLVDEFYLERALLAANPVCRVSIRAPSGHERGCATGFMVSPRLLITNEHVFGSAEEAAPSIVEFNYRFDVAGRPEPSYRFRLRPDRFFFNDEELDFALVSVEQESLDGGVPLGAFGYHRLIGDQGKILLKEWMTIIQHPGGARRQFAVRENECVSVEDPDVIWYKSDTAQGSSGSPVFNDSFQIIALHHAGIARQDDDQNFVLKNGHKVKDLSDADDSEVDWIANAGIRASRIIACVKQKAREKDNHLAELQAAMQGGDILSEAYRTDSQPTGEAMNSRLNQLLSPRPSGAPEGVGNNRIVLGTLVLELNGGLVAGAPAAQVGDSAARPALLPAPDQSSDLAETLKEPIIDTDYGSRKGFDRGFLKSLGIALPLPMPEVTNKSLLAAMDDGGQEIPYEHFSVFLHKTRKLAVLTASNVDGSAKAKHPEAGRDYSRKGLTGLSGAQQEKWVVDPRVGAQFQIPDQFYNKDNAAFDKGHIVRRDDVCFGTTYAQVQRANGDTFHVTNCSPQRGNFNRSNLGGIWGNLENFIGAQSDKERYCIFAGPVLSPADETFVGTERVQIPTRFWKVVCAVKSKKLQVFAFVLEQDVADLPLEFQPTAEWKHRQVKLSALEKLIKLVKFPKVYRDADQA